MTTPLRQRMIDDLKLRNYSPRTIETYVAHIARFSVFYSCPPEKLGSEEVRRYQLHMIEVGISYMFTAQRGNDEGVPITAPM